MLKSYTQRHQRARLVFRKAYWDLNDRPAVMRPSLQLHEMWTPDGSNFEEFGRPSYSHAELDQAVENYIAHSRKTGFWSAYDTELPTDARRAPKFTAGSLREYRDRVKEYHQRLQNLFVQAAEKNDTNGHSAARERHRAARDAEVDAWHALQEYVVAKAPARELATFANYVVAVGNNDAEFHISQAQARNSRTAKVPLPSFNEIIELSMRHRGESLRIIQKALLRLAAEKTAQSNVVSCPLKASRPPLRRAA